MGHLDFHLHLPTDSPDFSEDEYTSFITHIINIIEYVDCEKNSTLNYDKNNILDFINHFEAIKELYSYINTTAAVIQLLLNVGSEYDQPYEVIIHQKYSLWDSRSHEKTNTPITLHRAAHMAAVNSNKHLYINLCYSFKYWHSSSFFFIIDPKSQCTNEAPRLIEINHASTLKNIHSWTLKNRDKRTINIYDKRHIIHSSEYLSGKSPLLYNPSANAAHSEKLQSLLDSAYSDKRKTKDLINYDSDKSLFIWFEYEGETNVNQYHAYHLADPSDFSRKLSAEEKIPSRIKHFIDLLNPSS